MRAVCLMLVLAGCYHPEPVAGAPCAAGGVCPSGLVCRQGLCVGDGMPSDAAPDAVHDASVDARTLDAFVSVVGCADGTREAFVDQAMYPTLAGCAATWVSTQSLRSAKSGAPCGGTVACTVPADACATGWHLCANTGDPTDLSSRIDATACHTAGGASGTFVAATSHCTAFTPSCTYDLPLPCAAAAECSEPVCCGATCRMDNGCKAGVYADPDTWIAGSTSDGCGALLASSVTGVMCCRD